MTTKVLILAVILSFVLLQMPGQERRSVAQDLEGLAYTASPQYGSTRMSQASWDSHIQRLDLNFVAIPTVSISLNTQVTLRTAKVSSVQRMSRRNLH